jgi:hypothetical protein
MTSIRYASWDLAHIHFVDEQTGLLRRLFPQDKTANASGLRRPLDPIAPQPVAATLPALKATTRCARYPAIARPISEASGKAALTKKIIDWAPASGEFGSVTHAGAGSDDIS